MLGELISAGGALLGGLFGKKSADKANEQNIQLQREFAQQGIQWKVADAKKAGIHPLAALGAQTTSFTPSVVGDSSLGQGMAQAGQDIGRAVNATKTAQSREAQLGLALLEEQVKGARLDNAGRAIQNAALASRTVRNNAVGPSFPAADGKTNTGIAGQNASAGGLKIGGVALPQNPGTSTASDLSNVYGEPGENVGGLVQMLQTERQMTAAQKMAMINAVLGPAFVVSKTPDWYKRLKQVKGRDTSRTDSPDYPF